MPKGNPWEKAIGKYKSAKERVGTTRKNPRDSLFELSMGSNYVRILPLPDAEPGELPVIWFYAFSKLPQYPVPNDNKLAYTKCYEVGVYEDEDFTCPVKATITRLEEDGFDLLRVKPYLDAYMNVVVYHTQGSDVTELTVKPFRMYDNIFDAILEIVQTSGDIADVERGRKINIIAKPRGSSRGFSYQVVPCDPEPLATGPEELNEILRRRFNLDVFAPRPGDEDFQQAKEIAEKLEAFVRMYPDRFAPGKIWKGDFYANLPRHSHGHRHKRREPDLDDDPFAGVEEEEEQTGLPVEEEPDEASADSTSPVSLDELKDMFRKDNTAQPPCFGIAYEEEHESCKVCPKVLKCKKAIADKGEEEPLPF